MKIGFDAKRLFLNDTGLGNYSRTLVADFRSQYPDEEIFLFTPRTRRNQDTLPFLDKSQYNIVTGNGSGAMWRSLGITNDIARIGLDIYHGLSNELPFKKAINTKYVVTIHDVIYKAFPEQYKWFDRKVYDIKTSSALQGSDAVLAISRETIRDLERYYNFSNAHLLYQTCGQQFSYSYAQRQGYLLYVSSITPRKNLITILKALHQLNTTKVYTLKVVGSGGKYADECKAFAEANLVPNQVEFLGSVSNAELNSLYQSAELFVYPSLKEGFGIPIIESLGVGTKVVTTANSAMSEAGGDLGYYIDNPLDVATLAEAINEAYHQQKPSEVDVKQHLAQFDAKKITRQLYNVYNQLLQSS